MKERVAEMEREAEKLRELQAAAESEQNSTAGSAGAPMDTEDDKAISDGRSVYVGNVCFTKSCFNEKEILKQNQVDYSATPEEIQAHFQACGIINRVTILCDKFTGHPKGSATFMLPSSFNSYLFFHLQVCLRRVC